MAADFGFGVHHLVEDEGIFEGPGALQVSEWHKENIRVLRLVLANHGGDGADRAGDEQPGGVPSRRR